MTEQIIPLSRFVDTSDPLLPKGHLTTAGLNSAMSNPLISKTNPLVNYRSQIVFNQRLRDLPEWPINIDTVRAARIGSQTYGTGWKRDDDGGGDDGVIRLGAAEGFATTENWNMLASSDIIVYVSAVKILRNTPWVYDGGTNAGSRAGTKMGFYGSASGYYYISGPQSESVKNIYARYKPTAGDPWPTVFLLNENSYNKWIIFFLVFKKNDITKCKIFVKGGQFSEITSYNASGFTNFDANMTEALRIYAPGGSGTWGGFCTVAAYSGLNDAGSDGLDSDDIEWNLFDSEHICGSCSVVGNSIEFSCTGNVAWDVKIDSTWCNDKGEPLDSSCSNRYFCDTGETTITTPFDFTEIRPVLKNSGNLNSDNLSILHNVSTMNTNKCLDQYSNRKIIHQQHACSLTGLGNKIKRLNINV